MMTANLNVIEMTEITLSKDCERASLAQANLQYVGDPVGWAGLWTYRTYQIELRINGNEQGLDARLVQLAEIVLPVLQKVESASNEYLHQFIDLSERQFYTGSWKLRSLIVRQEPGSRRIFGSEFEVTLSIREDDYGQWSVRFAHHTQPSSVLSPYFFSRRQY